MRKAEKLIASFFTVDREEILNILQEAALVKYASRKRKIEMENGTVDDDHVYASIMADLQIRHSKESEEMTLQIMQYVSIYHISICLYVTLFPPMMYFM